MITNIRKDFWIIMIEIQLKNWLYKRIFIDTKNNIIV